MSRNLTDREREVLTFMVDHALPVAEKRPVRASVRERWRRSIPTIVAGPTCECGGCPSIDLVDGCSRTSQGGRNIVLSASSQKASVLLFIEHDRLSYLELAPHEDDIIGQFPPISELDV